MFYKKASFLFLSLFVFVGLFFQEEDKVSPLPAYKIKAESSSDILLLPKGIHPYEDYFLNVFNKEPVVVSQEAIASTDEELINCEFCKKTVGTVSFIYASEKVGIGQIAQKTETLVDLSRHKILVIENTGRSEIDLDLIPSQKFEYIVVLGGPRFKSQENIVYLSPSNEKIYKYLAFYERSGDLYISEESVKSSGFTKAYVENLVIPIYEIEFDEVLFDEQWEKLPKRKTLEKNWQLWNSNNGVFKSIKARINIDKVSHEGKLKIRGDVDNHWVNTKKSFNFKLKSPIGGQSLMRFIMAEDRGVNYPFLYESSLKNGSIHPQVKLVWLRVNDRDMGAYYYFEPLDKVFLESRGLSGDAFIYKNEWEQEKFGRMIKVFDDLSLFSKDPKEHLFKDELDVLYQAIKTTDVVRLKNILDTESFVRWYVNILYLGDRHQNEHDNLRLIFDPTAGRFVFITWDPVMSKVEEKQPLLRDASPISKILLQDDEIKKQVLEALSSLVNDGDRIAADKDLLKRTYESVTPAFLGDRHNGVLGVSVEGALERFSQNIEVLKTLLNSYEK